MKRRGSSTLISVFIIGMVSLLIGFSLAKIGTTESLINRSPAQSLQALYAAESGIEDAVYRIKNGAGNGEFDLSVAEAQAHVLISGTESEKQIISTGHYKNYIRKIEAVMQNTTIEPDFKYAIHAGQGGITLRNQTKIFGKNNTNGDIFSNGSIRGAKNDYDTKTFECKQSSSYVDGIATAVEDIDKIEPNDSGICSSKDAYANNFNYCFIRESAHGPNNPSSDCPYNEQWEQEDQPEEEPLPDMNIAGFKRYMDRRADIFTGDCIADGSGASYDCTKGTNLIGDLIITGNLTKPSNVDLFINKPVWVKGNAVFNSQGIIKLPAGYQGESQMMVVDGTITVDSNVQFGAVNSAFIFFLSTYTTSESEICDDPAITLSSNSQSVLFYAVNGCVVVTANSTFHGSIIGEKVEVANNSQVEFDPALSSTGFNISGQGGWQIISYKER